MRRAISTPVLATGLLYYLVLSKVYFFESPHEIPGLFETTFGGFFLIKGLPIFFQLAFLLLLFLSGFAAYQYHINHKELWRRIGVFSSACCLFTCAFLLFQPWDELFVSLRHSYNLGTGAGFSFNREMRIEGIVDFLPFFLLGLLAKLNFPLLETNFMLGILGTWLCVLAGRTLLTHFGYEKKEVWLYPLLILYPPLLLNTGHGFPVTLFTAAILWSVVYVHFESTNWKRYALLSLVPLIRLEGIWFTCLELCYLFWTQRDLKTRKNIILGGLASLAPIGILSLWRYVTFGTAIPTPVLYKSSFGNLFFLLLGLRNLGLDLFASGTIIFLFFILHPSRNRSVSALSASEQKGLSVLAILCCFCLPYYISGGDWFPPAWGRYLFPLSFFAYIFALRLIHRTPKSLGISPMWLPVWISSFLIVLMPFGSTKRLWENLFTHKTTLAGLNQNKRVGRPNNRIQYLSKLGTHFKNTTPTDSVIASSEVASIMYFASREALDLLGVANPELAAAPLRPTPRLFSPARNYNELPHLIFKRLKPSIIEEKKPDFFYAFDFMVSDLLELQGNHPVSREDLRIAITRWKEQFAQMNEALFGGLKQLEDLGYSPVLIRYGKTFYCLYFVSPEARNVHFQKMNLSGMTLTELTEVSR